MPTNDSEWKEHFTNWAHQTLMFAFSVKGFDLGRQLNPTVDLEHANAAYKEAERISKIELWDDAVQRCGQNMDAIGLTYTRLVLDWCAKHLGYQSPNT